MKAPLGANFSLEHKALVICALFAGIKFFSISSLVGRSFFICAHTFLTFMCLQASLTVTKLPRATDEFKVQEKSKLKALVKSIILKVIVVCIVHAMTGLIPPLFVSSAFNTFAVLENGWTRNEISKIFGR